MKFDAKEQRFTYNEGYTGTQNPELMASNVPARFSGSFKTDRTAEMTVTDPMNQVSFTLKPKFDPLPAKQEQNQLLYRLTNANGYLVYTARATGVKEDIVLDSFKKDTAEFAYELSLPSGLEPRLEADGSIGVYGVASALLGNVATATEQDQQLLEKARNNAAKTQLLFSIPAPVVVEGKKQLSSAQAHFDLEGTILRVKVQGLKDAKFPLSIDPSVYIQTAAQLMKGNNETNVDFDVDNELIQKSQTTGARIDDWTSTSDLAVPAWGQGTAVAGGYIYVVGGGQGSTVTTTTYYTAGSFTFNVPAGISVITVKAWGAGGGGGAGTGSSGQGGNGGGGGYAKSVLTVTPTETLDVLVGTGGARATAASDGGNGGGYSAVKRSATFLVQAGAGGGGGGSNGSGDGGNGGAGGGVNGTAGGSSTGGGGGAGTSVGGGAGGSAGSNGSAGAAGVANAGGNGGLGSGGGSGGAGGTGAGGTSNGSYEAGGGGGGRFGGGGGGSSGAGGLLSNNNRGGGGGGGGSDLVTGTSTVETAGSGATPGNSSDSQRNGAGQGGSGSTSSGSTTAGAAGGVVISYATPGPATSASVYWAHFNSSTGAIESANPGNGACSGWCTNGVYDLPVSLTGMSLVAYNGFLYAFGGINSGGSRVSTVYIAKLGATGEPQLWHPTGGSAAYWYSASLNGSTAKSYMAAVASNNRIYVLGGETNASPNGITTVEKADILPTGALDTWTTTGMQALPGGAGTHMHSIQVYNDVLYTVGGFEGAKTSSANLRSSVYYSKLNSDGTMNAWQATNNFSAAGARATMGGNFSTIWGAYIYVGGGCTAVNASGYCTTIASDVVLASINADGSLSEWNTIGGLTNQRIGHTFIAWQGGLYRLGGCRSQDAAAGDCIDTVFDVDYGIVNPAGEVSTVSISVPSGTSPCSGGAPYNCDLPPVGDSAGQGGQMLSMSAIMNGYLYVIGGCSDSGGTLDCTSITGNISYAAIDPSGRLTKPATCSGTSYGAWCVDSTNRINGTTGVAAAGVATFNNRIYVVGGVDTTTDGSTNIYYNSTNTNGSLAGAWSSTSFATAGVSGELAYAFAYTRANPASAGTNPGNLYIFGGCGDVDNGAGCATNNYRQDVYKCNITTTGAIAGCSTSGQLQIDSSPGYGNATDGLGIHSGTVYANYIYLIGGFSQFESDKDDVLYAKFDNSNNVVAVSGSDWIESPNKLSVGRRRGFAFGYNGHIYAVGGYDADGTTIIPFIEWSKMNVSDGSIDVFVTSSVTINQRWGLSMVVSNSYAYVIGGCDVGASPGSCTSFEDSIQTFQLFNNDSGTPAGYSTSATTYGASGTSTSPNRIGASTAILNGYIYVAGGCVSATDCTLGLKEVSYAPIDVYGVIGTWSDATGLLPEFRSWGQLEAVGGTLYYIGGQGNAGAQKKTVYWGTPVAGGNVTSFTDATYNLGDSTGGGNGVERTQMNATVWNNRLYVTGGINISSAVTSTVFVSPSLSAGGDITSAWTSTTAFNVARSGHVAIAYANNLYILGGYDGANYLSDVQYAKINSDGTVGAWTYTTSLPKPLRQGDGFAVNGFIYIFSGRSSDTVCDPVALVAPISANTTIATGNNPTGIGEWYQTNQKYTGARYGGAAVYHQGKAYVLGGGCGTTLTYATPVTQQTALLSQPQVAKYSRLIDADKDVFPTVWLMNGIDNSIGARWQFSYRSMNDVTVTDADKACGGSAMSNYGQTTNFGDVTLGQPGAYTVKNSGGTNISCGRYFFLNIYIDASQTFGYPEDVNRGPTLWDFTLFFRSNPGKRLIHGKTFIEGVQQPLDTQCGRSNPIDVQSVCPNP